MTDETVSIDAFRFKAWSVATFSWFKVARILCVLGALGFAVLTCTRRTDRTIAYETPS